MTDFNFQLLESRLLLSASAQQLVDWGTQVNQETIAKLGVSGTSQFAETALLAGGQTGGSGSRAYVWPMSTEFRVKDALAELDLANNTAALRQFSDQLFTRYWNNSGGYRSSVSAGSTRFYDDNGHVAVAILEAYRITGDNVYLARATNTYNFVLSGEDNVGGGGIYFQEFDHSSKDAISTLQGARAAAMLYQATGQAKYLNDAIRLYTWAKNTIQQPDGLFMERLNLTGPKAGQVGDNTLVNSAGIAISLNLELYKATHTASYLTEAQRIANRSLTRYFDSSTGRINDEGFWAFELVDAFDDLFLHDGNAKWLSAVNTALSWLHQNKLDPNGHYDKFWGRNGAQTATLSSWNLNEQASVARAYLYTGLTSRSLVINGSTVADKFYLRLSPDHATIQVWRGSTPTGSPTYTSPFASTPSLSFFGLGGNDELIIDLSDGSPLPAAGLWFDGGTGSDTLTFTGSTIGDSLTINPSQILVNGNSIADVSCENLVLSPSGNNLLMLSSLSVAGRVARISGTGDTFFTDAVSITAGGVLDLADAAMILQASLTTRDNVLASIQQLIASARNAAPRWTGSGLTSSVAAADVLGGLAAILNDNGTGQPLHTTFGGLPVSADSVLVKYALNGDLDINGVVDADDYFHIDQGFVLKKSGYANGDIDFNGVIDADDYYLIDAAYLGQSSKLASASAVKPSALAKPPQQGSLHRHHRRTSTL